MHHNFRVAGSEFAPGRPLVIAEIGTSHEGDVAKAFDLVDAAAEAGADCAKFQCVFAEEIVHPNTGSVPLPGGPVPIYERFRALELDADFYAAVKERAEAKGLLFLCTPFGLRSARLLRRLDVRAMKVASPELNHLPLIDELASYGLPVLVSSGVSTLADIERALKRLACPVLLLHCVTAYPAPAEEYNLRLLAGLSSVFGLPTGVSDHSADPILVPSLAVASGATCVEKHICLSRGDPGLDDPIALPPADFATMVKAVRRAAELPAQATVAALSDRYGPEIVEAVLGDGVKRLAPSEAGNYYRTNRSIHALRAIKPGEAFSAENLALLRTEKVLRPGLGPELLHAVLGRVARRAVPSGEGVVWEDVGDLQR
ncbi:MAG: N-acetylneuraminate synthase family protein [Spirochaetaceae bacterium]|nr:N-acetylneuraminate synthase family protein [Spirochaetaceae bacterium]